MGEQDHTEMRNSHFSILLPLNTQRYTQRHKYVYVCLACPKNRQILWLSQTYVRHVCTHVHTHTRMHVHTRCGQGLQPSEPPGPGEGGDEFPCRNFRLACNG